MGHEKSVNDESAASKHATACATHKCPDRLRESGAKACGGLKDGHERTVWTK
jgi:hypothetical protein